MNHTVIGLFNDNTQIQRAVERLEAIGISSKNIDVARRQGQGGYVKDEPGQPKEWVGTDNVNDNNLSRFFKSLFSSKGDETSERYSRAASSGQAVVTVLTASREEAERVADLLDECGAINVDEHAAATGDSSMRSSAAPTQPITTEGERTTPMADTNLANENRSGETTRVRSRSQIIERSLDDDLRLRDEGNSRRDDIGLDRNRPGAGGF